MKTLLLFASLAGILTFSACDEEEGPGPFTGSWQFGSDTPPINASFTIKGNPYTIDGIIVNDASWENFELREVAGNYVDEIVIRTKEFEPMVEKWEALIFINCTLSSDRSTITMDSVYYRKGVDVTYLKNQVLTRTE